jgi:hypothetical protein
VKRTSLPQPGTETEDPETGWAFLTGTLTAAGFPADTWPAAMRLVRDEDLPAPDPEPPPRHSRPPHRPPSRSRSARPGAPG